MTVAVQEKPIARPHSLPNNKSIGGATKPESIGHRLLRQFSLDEYHQLIELGFFHEDERIELLNGLLVEMSPINPKHAECVDQATEQLLYGLYKRARVRVQSPITLEIVSSEPQPDITIAAFHPAGYGKQHPQAEDVLLVIEVADSSLEDDRDQKLETYALAGIPEYWIFNLVDVQTEIYREPYVSASGRAEYKTKLTFTRDQVVAPLSFPDCQIDLSQILPSKEVIDP
jgi:Uma2 family endonuclease